MKKSASFLTAACAVMAIALAGCNPSKPTKTVNLNAGATDSESAILAPLESTQDSAKCHEILQQLDSLPSINERPAMSETERAELARFLQLTPSEVGETAQSNFSATDYMYLSEALLIRTGVRSLRLDKRTPLEQAQHCFDWVCRLNYVDERVPWPANPWLTYQLGWGGALSRAYAILAAWQQQGLDCCLIGPAALKESASVTPNTVNPAAPPFLAPVRACAVKIGKDVYLFDHVGGKPLPNEKGTGVLTLAEVRAKPELVAALKLSEEPKDWRPFLAPPLAAISRRMEWLQKLNPGNVGVKLFIDVARQRTSFTEDIAGIPCEAWNPSGDSHNASRILGRVVTEESSDRSKAALRDLYRVETVPLKQMPKTSLQGSPLEYLLQTFARPFDSLRYAPTTPRDLLLRGQLQESTTLLEDKKRMVEDARVRFEQDPNLKRDVGPWSERLGQLFAQVNDAKLRDPARVSAALKALEDFRGMPASMDIERAIVWGSAAKPLAADVNYMIAECIHERAERAQLDSTPSAAANWRNAAEWWTRFLDASNQAQSPFPAREAHARNLLARCRQFTGK